MSPDQSAPVTIPPQNAEVILASRQTSNKSLIIFSIVFLFLIISLIINFMQFQGTFLNSGILADNNIKLVPINPQKPFIKSYAMNYYVETVINDISETSSGTEIVTNIQDEQFPRVYIQPQTLFYIDVGNKIYNPIRKDQLKKGQKIGILIFYSELKEAKIMRITVLP